MGKDKLYGQHCFELSDYAQGGNLMAVKNFKQHYTYEFIQTNVIKEIFNGLQQLHRSDIIHCDLKPPNIFYLDAAQTNLVIGDYGSARTRNSNTN